MASGGWDVHDDLVPTHDRLLRELDGALNALYNSTIEMGVANAVTSFTASDFNRDFGWLDRVMDLLAKKFHVFAPDSYGSGKSPDWHSDRPQGQRPNCVSIRSRWSPACSRA